MFVSKQKLEAKESEFYPWTGRDLGFRAVK